MLRILTIVVLALNATASAVLVSRWQGEGNAVDSAGANNGTVIGTLQYTPGVIGHGFLFPDDESRSDEQGNAMLVDPTATFDIGRSIPLGSPFEGMLDDVRFYNHALTANEVAALVPEPSMLSLAAAAAPGMMLRRRARKAHERKPALCESLENRKLLSDIAWTNRGNDGFAQAFGTNANQARLIVDRAIADWEEVIVSFNNLPGQNTFNLIVDAVDINSIAGAFITADSAGKPTAATIQVDSVGTTHWLDPTVGDDAEFDDDISNAFTGFAQNPAIVGVDLYATMIHELGHALGFNQTRAGLAIQNFLSDSGVDDPNTTDAGNLWAINLNGGPIEATMTRADHSHLWEGPGTPATNAAGLPSHPDVLMNPGRAIRAFERNLISDFEAGLLRDIYGYTIKLPGTINNMLVNPNFTTDVLTVVGLPGSVNDSFIIQGDANPNVLHVTVDGLVEIVPLAEVGTIVVNGGDGGDLFRLEYAGGRFTTFNGGNGIDTIDLAFVTRNLSNIGGPTKFNGGPDADFMHLYDNNYTASDAFFVDEDSLTRFGTGIQQYDSAVENVFLTTGTNHNAVNISRTSSLTKLYLNSSGGQDLVNIGPSQFSINGQIEVQNDPSFTTINIDDTGNPSAETANINLSGQFGWIEGLNATIFWDNADVQEVHVTTGGGNDIIDVLRCSERLFIDNSGGRDAVRIGNTANGLQQITAQIDIDSTPAGVLTDLTLNDAASSIARTVTFSQVGSDTVVSGFAPVLIRYDRLAVDTFTILAGLANDTIVLNNTLITRQITVDAGGGVDQVHALGVEVTSLVVRGGSDAALDFLDINDQTFPGNVVGGSVYADRIDRDIFQQVSQVFYSGFASVNWYQQQQQNAIAVFGMSPDIHPNFQFSIIGNTIDDYLQVFTHDAQGNPTINGNLRFDGGGGPDVVHVFSGNNSVNYRFYDPFGGTTAYLGGIGAGWLAIAPDVENIGVFGSPANDTFAVEKFSAGTHLAIFGGNGNDNCTIGNGDMAANLTNAASFTFDGQAGADRFTVDNGLTNSPWVYLARTGILNAGRASPSYLWSSNTLNIESQYVRGGSSDDTFHMEGSASGLYTEWNGFGGTEVLYLSDFFTGNLDPIRGPVRFNPGAGISAIWASDVADTTPDTVHLDATSLGAYAGDNLFGPGGSLTFENIVNVAGSTGITLLVGQNNTVYAQPFPNVRTEIASGGGGSIKLALAGVQSPVINGTSASGSVTSSNRQPLLWSQFTGPIQTDAIAPVPQQIKFKVGGGGRSTVAPTSIEVQFSEDVSGLLNPSFLSLQNLTTNSTVPTSNIAVAWNAGTLTATFTFPGYAGGVLPNGSYQAQLLAGLTDLFGNPMAASNLYKFIWTAGTSGDDNFRVARAGNFSDLHVFMNNDATPAFVGASDLSQIAIAGDAGSDALIVDCTNLNPTPTTDGIVFDGGDGADSVKVKGSANVDGVTYFSDYIMPGATLISHPNVETQLYDGGGGFDSLGVYGTTVILPVSQGFASIDINQSGKLTMQPNLDGLLITRGLTIAATSTLDLDDSDMIVDYTGATQLAQIQSQINSARNGGAWNGAGGINSTSARNANPRIRTLGAIEASDFKVIYGASATFAGETIDTTAVLVKYTYYGDADFNGIVNFDDYSRTDAGFNFGRTGWLNGDFDGNGVVNFDDYSLIDLAFNSQ